MCFQIRVFLLALQHFMFTPSFWLALGLTSSEGFAMSGAQKNRGSLLGQLKGLSSYLDTHSISFLLFSRNVLADQFADIVGLIWNAV